MIGSSAEIFIKGELLMAYDDNDDDKCAHGLCTCMVDDDLDYCSPQCETAGTTCKDLFVPEKLATKTYGRCAP